MKQFENLNMKTGMKTKYLLGLIMAVMLMNSGCHNKYKGMCKEDREKMKMVARFNAAQAKGSCPADKVRIKKQEEEQKLAKKSQKKAASKK